MNLPNLISLSRIPMLFIIIALLYLPIQGMATAAFILSVLGGLTDWLDGYVARKVGSVSNFGKVIDALTDKIYVIGSFLVLLGMDLIPAWTMVLIVLVMCREFLVTGLRIVAASKGLILGAERTGKLKTFTQLFTIGTYICINALYVDFEGVFFAEPLIKLGTYIIGPGCLILSVILALLSGVSYLTKNWKVLSEEM